MSRPSSRVQKPRSLEPVRRIRRPQATRARQRAQARIRFLTGAVIVGAGGATAWISTLVASEHPGATAPALPAQPGTQDSPAPPSTPTTSAPATTTPGVPAAPTSTTTIPPTTTATRPLVTSGGTSSR